MALKTEAVTVGTTAAEAFIARHGTASAPQTVVIVNNDATATVYWGGTDDVTADDGVPIGPGQSGSVGMLAGDVLCLVADEADTDVRLGYRS